MFLNYFFVCYEVKIAFLKGMPQTTYFSLQTEKKWNKEMNENK